MLFQSMRKEGYASAIQNRIKQAKAGSVFAMVDFADLAPDNAANRVVARLAAEGVLRVSRFAYPTGFARPFHK